MEIGTPLIGISGMVTFLLDTPLNGEQLDYCHTISQSSDGLLSVINDILDLSKVEAGMMRLNPTWFRMDTLIGDAHELLSTMAIAKDLELNYVVDEDVPSVVCGDRVRLRQVLLNIIGVSNVRLRESKGCADLVGRMRSSSRIRGRYSRDARLFTTNRCRRMRLCSSLSAMIQDLGLIRMMRSICSSRLVRLMGRVRGRMGGVGWGW